ncbi:Abi family protein, partial [Corynebacterium striatum]
IFRQDAVLNETDHAVLRILVKFPWHVPDFPIYSNRTKPGALHKPHLSFAKQLDLLESRGVALVDRARHVSDLKYYGYYRLSAYFYPFRRLVPQEECSSPFSFRGDEFLDEVQFDDAVNLAKFDSRLRRTAFEGLEHIEVALRTRVAYHAGRVDPFIHLTRSALDEKECSKLVGEEQSQAYVEWERKYETLCLQAKSEDFIKHFNSKYGDCLPIWIAVEVMDFGGLVRLFGLLPPKTRSAIAKEFGVSNGNVLKSWVICLNYMRNKVAHHSRLWNRTMTYALRTPDTAQVDQPLHHLAAEKRNLNTVYDYLAIVTYLLSKVDRDLMWHRRVKETMKKSPKVPHLSLEEEMGFPSNWQQLSLWT